MKNSRVSTIVVSMAFLGVSWSAQAGLNSGSFQGTDNYQGTCQVKIQATQTSDQYDAVLGYTADHFQLAPSVEMVNKQKQIKNNEYSAKVLKPGTQDPSAITSIKCTLVVQIDDTGKPLKYFYFDNTDDGPKFKRRQYTCNLN